VGKLGLEIKDLAGRDSILLKLEWWRLYEGMCGANIVGYERIERGRK